MKAGEEMVTCMNCGEEIKTSDAIPVYALGEEDPIGYICPECIGDGYEYCHETDKVYEEKDLEYIEDKGYYVNREEALRSYYCCQDCGEYYSEDNINLDDYGNVICQQCFNRYDYYFCSDCGRIINNDDVCFDRDGEPYCEDCYPGDSDYDDYYVHYYEYKPSPVFHGEGSLFMGVELETDCTNGHYDRGNCSEELYKISDGENLFYQKYDCSLSDGIEVVTHPCTLDYHLKEFPWEKIAEISLENGMCSHNAGTCGMHVHVNRTAFGSNPTEQDLTIAKVMLWFDRHWNNVYRFSRRTRHTIQWGDRPSAGFEPTDDAEAVVKKSKEAGRHRGCVNLLNTNTVEFRVFRGSLKINTIKATLQFVSNIINYAKSRTLPEVQNSTWEDAVDIVTFPELTAYLDERGLSSSSSAQAA